MILNKIYNESLKLAKGLLSRVQDGLQLPWRGLLEAFLFLLTTLRGPLSLGKKMAVLYIYVSVNVIYYAVVTKTGFVLFLFALIYGSRGMEGDALPSQWFCSHYVALVVGKAFSTWFLFLFRGIRDFMYNEIGRDYITSRIGNTTGRRALLGVIVALLSVIIADQVGRAYARNLGDKIIDNTGEECEPPILAEDQACNEGRETTIRDLNNPKRSQEPLERATDIRDKDVERFKHKINRAMAQKNSEFFPVSRHCFKKLKDLLSSREGGDE